jgi:hypothetical protein
VCNEVGSTLSGRSYQFRYRLLCSALQTLKFPKRIFALQLPNPLYANFGKAKLFVREPGRLALQTHS